MKDRDIKNAITKCPEFNCLNDTEVNALAAISVREVFRKGEEIFTINHEGKKFYIVLEGRLSLHLKTGEFKEYTKGQLFGEVAILGKTMRFGTIRASEESMLISFDKDALLHSDKISKELALKVIMLLTQKAISYLNPENYIGTKQLIEKGECQFIEFKKSVHEHNKTNIAKTLVSFMNSNGGSIICGVDDLGKITGIDLDRKSFDELQKMLNREITYKIGMKYRQYIHYDIEKIDNKKVVRIDCKPTNTPAYFKKYDKNGHALESFVVRSGSENMTMTKIKDILEYSKERF